MAPRTRNEWASLEAEVERLVRAHHPECTPLGGAIASLDDLRAARDYLTAAPRTTPYGRLLTAADAAAVVGKTLANRGNLRLAMALDMNDNQFRKIATSLKATGLTGAANGPLDEGERLKLAAVLWAEETVFFKFNQLRFKPALQGFYALVAARPADAGAIIQLALERSSLDAELIEQALDAPAKALRSGTL